MLTEINSTPCPICGSSRDENLGAPCPNCQSRNRPLLGYVYPHEWRAFFLMAGIALLAILVAVGLFAYYWYNVRFILGV